MPFALAYFMNDLFYTTKNFNKQKATLKFNKNINFSVNF